MENDSVAGSGEVAPEGADEATVAAAEAAAPTADPMQGETGSTAPDTLDPKHEHRWHLYHEQSKDGGASWFGDWVHQGMQLPDLESLVADIRSKLP